MSRWQGIAILGIWGATAAMIISGNAGEGITVAAFVTTLVVMIEGCRE